MTSNGAYTWADVPIRPSHLSRWRKETRRAWLPWLLFLPLIVSACTDPPAAPSDLVYIQTGSFPLIVTAPHGGNAAVPGVEQRVSRGAVLDRDWRTDRLVRDLTARIEALVGAAPYVVAAQFDRKFIDANRPRELAYEDTDAAPFYDAYHDTVRRFIDEVREKYPAPALLIDVHGQAKEGFRDSVCRGTRDGATVARLAGRHGAKAVTGPSSVLGKLQEAGYAVYPEGASFVDGKESACFDGGYTVATYGSHNCDGVDAIQLEVGRGLREDGAISRFTEALAVAAMTFNDRYQQDVVKGDLAEKC